jgi:hypothetical protein
MMLTDSHPGGIETPGAAASESFDGVHHDDSQRVVTAEVPVSAATFHRFGSQSRNYTIQSLLLGEGEFTWHSRKY